MRHTWDTVQAEQVTGGHRSWAQKERWGWRRPEIHSRRRLELLAYCFLPLKCPDEPARCRSCRFNQLGSKALNFWANEKPHPRDPV